MDLINNNKTIILNWYNKQKNKPIPPSLENIGSLTQTKYVKNPDIVMLENKFDCLLKGNKIINIKVEPLLIRNLCHYNCLTLLNILNKKKEQYKIITGYCITSCPCGKLICLELHSVLQHIETKQYIDLTTDYGKEQSKWFIPLFDDLCNLDINYILRLGLEFCFIGQKHKCNNIPWSGNNNYCCDIDEFVKRLYEIEN